MVYVQYFHKDLSGQLVEALGDRSIVILDGRNNLETMKQDAVSFNGVRRPVYDAYQIRKGDSFSRSQPITGIVQLDTPKPAKLTL